MSGNPLDDRSVNRLLNGEVTADDAPPGYARVAALLSAARPQPASQELPLEAATVMVMQANISSDVPVASTRRKQMLGKVLTAKAAAVAGALLLTASGAAAATGSLPGAAQDVASSALAKVGISVPGHDSHAGDHPDSRGNSADHSNKSDDSTHTTGPNEHAQFGQCTAQAASAGHPNDHSAVAGATGCTDVTHPGNPGGTDQGQGTDDHGDNGADHKPASTPAGPPASTPASDHAHAGTPDKGASGDDHGNSTDSTGNDVSSSGSGNSGDHGRP